MVIVAPGGVFLLPRHSCCIFSPNQHTLVTEFLLWHNGHHVPSSRYDWPVMSSPELPHMRIFHDPHNENYLPIVVPNTSPFSLSVLAKNIDALSVISCVLCVCRQRNEIRVVLCHNCQRRLWTCKEMRCFVTDLSENKSMENCLSWTWTWQAAAPAIFSARTILSPWFSSLYSAHLTTRDKAVVI